ATARGATLVPSFDDRCIIAGQGTLGLELMDQAAAMGASLEVLVGPVGGGGLMGGVGVAAKARRPSVEIWGVEPEGFDDTRLSLAAGTRRGASPTVRSLCDALESPMPGELTFPLLQATLAGIVTVADAEVAEAMRVAFDILKLVVEPGGAVALAALLTGRIAARGRTVAIILSGANVDPALFARVLRAEL
ncbi:MAG: pyridoxal-phosphate dependent enzyme, partial [Caulobacteraceae bacterium]